MLIRSARLPRAWTPRPYLGQVATRCRLHASLIDTGVPFTFSTRTMHVAADNLTMVRLAWANWWASFEGGEQGSGNTLTIAASIEYPEGTVRRVTFNGATSVGIASGATQWSDWTAVSIPRGEWFGVRTFFSSNRFFPATIPGDFDMVLVNESLGDRLVFSVDITGGGSVEGLDSDDWVGPVSIIGWTRRPSFGLVGDSRVAGYGDSVADGQGDMGMFARSLGPECGYLNAGISSDTAVTFLASSTLRLQLLKYCSHILTDYGTGDIMDGRSQSQAIADLQQLAALLRPRPLYNATMWAWSSSTDGWTTTVNQTVNPGWAPVAAFNDIIRARIPGLAGYFELGDVVSTSRDSGVWIAPSGVAHTNDGIHCNQAGYIRVRDAGVISPRKMFGSDVWPGAQTV